MRVDRRPAKATWLRSWRSLWYGHSVSVPLPRWVSPCAIRTMNRLLGSFAWNCANWRSIAANLQNIRLRQKLIRAPDTTKLSIYLKCSLLCYGGTHSGRYKHIASNYRAVLLHLLGSIRQKITQQRLKTSTFTYNSLTYSGFHLQKSNFKWIPA
jgi:hypothetical protein